MPVISTSNAIPNEILNYGQYGLLFDKTTEGIYSGMKQILDNDDLYKYYKEISIIRSSNFQLDKVMSEFD